MIAQQCTQIADMVAAPFDIDIRRHDHGQVKFRHDEDHLPFVVLDVTDRSWIYFGLAMIPGMVGIFLVMYWLSRKISDQNLAIEERDQAHLARAREEARRMLVDGAGID